MKKTTRRCCCGNIPASYECHRSGSDAAMTDEMKAKCGDQNHSTYLLGPGDQLQISDPELTELANKPVRVDGDAVSMSRSPAAFTSVGSLRSKASKSSTRRSAPTFVNPQVIVEVSEVHSQPVSVLGAVNTPGVHQVQGRKTLLETLALAEAYDRTRVTACASLVNWRGAAFLCPARTLIPLAGSRLPKLNLKKIMDAKTPEENIQIFPHDVISVRRRKWFT